MNRYISLITFTEQGAKNIKNSTRRAHAFALGASKFSGASLNFRQDPNSRWKTPSTPMQLFLTVLTSLSICSVNVRAADTNAGPQRIGIYDSRVVAYARFWSDAYQKKINAQVTAAKAAKTAGDTQKAEELGKAISDEQRRSHRTIFSTAPVDDVLAEIKDRLPGIQKHAGVSILVSKWDEAALKQHSKAERVEITDLLVREFKPGEKQLKVIADIKRQKPVPLDQIDKMKDH